MSGSANYLRDEKVSLWSTTDCKKDIHPANREDSEVQSGLQGHHKGGKPSLKHAQVWISLLTNFLIYAEIPSRNLTYGDVCASVQEQSSDGSGPTHIVASITYGMNAIMIFERVTT